MLNPDNFEVLTFDCYGTLIDWEAGIFSALKPILQTHGTSLPDSEILELYGDFEAKLEGNPYRSYREVLAGVVTSFGEHLGFLPTNREIYSLAEALPSWQPWPDTVVSLRQLQDRFRLAIISNIDDDLFDRTRELLGVQFAQVMTAQQAACYKPGLSIFEKAIRQIGIPADRLLHVGQSIFHDVRPAQALGISTVWVNRPSRRKNVGAVRRADAVPDLEVPGLKTLAETLLAR